MFSRQWEGIREGCWFEGELLEMGEFLAASRSEQECGSDDYVDAVDSIWQSEFDGKTVCGKLGS